VRRLALVLAALSAAAALSPAATVRGQEPAADPREANQALVRRYVAEVLAAGRLDRLGELVADDYADLSPGADPQLRGAEVVRASQARIRQLFTDLEYTIDELLADGDRGDRVVARYTVHATSVAGKPPEGSPPAEPRRIAVTGMTLFHLAGGRIRSTWTINDQLEMFRQLGYRCEQRPAEPAGGGRP
jgi:steroid delta-isomerase-like uncharacterized protein